MGPLVENPPEGTDDLPTTANGRDLLDHAVQYNPADADRRVTAAKIIAVENEARASDRAALGGGLDVERLYNAIYAVWQSGEGGHLRSGLTTPGLGHGYEVTLAGAIAREYVALSRASEPK